jgi:uncharacterized damage-inducible protein DinB
MKTEDTLTTLFSHHLWANLQLAEACAKLSDEQLDSTIVGTFGTIRDTVQHMALSERGYFSRISTGQRYNRPDDAPALTMAEAVESFRTTGQGLVTWSTKVQPTDTVQIKWLHGEVVAVPLTLLLTQVINHATEHRAQIMAILTQLGVQPPSLDGWTYFATQNGLPA